MSFEVIPPKPYSGECAAHGSFVGTISSILGREIKTGCPVCQEERREREAKAKADQDAMLRRMQVREKLGSAAIPARFLSKDFDGYQAGSQKQNTALSVCREYADNFDAHFAEGRCLMLLGKVGTGKTHLACAVANYLVRETNRTAVYRTVGAMLIELKATYDKYSESSEAQVMRGLTSPDLLVLDEVGATKPSEFELATLFAVINARYEQQRPTVIVSNLPANELSTAMGERCVDRLREGGGIVVPFDWQSGRRTA